MTRILTPMLAFVSIGILTGHPAVANDVSDIGRLLSRAPIVCGAFTQTKSLKALTRPLVSSGRVVFVSGKGVLWRVISPFPSQVLVKKNALIRWNSENLPERSNFGQTPQFRALSEVFFAIFTGDVSRLKVEFDVVATTGPDNWSLMLTPRDKEFAFRISDIFVSGGRFVKELRITEGQGDRTYIEFQELAAVGCVLSRAEKDSLAH